MAVRRAAFDRVGPFDVSRRHTDAPEWVLRAREAGLVTELLPEIMVERRLHLANQSKIHAEESLDEFLEFVRAMAARRR
jgi:GT2 family glycosyltransferase